MLKNQNFQKKKKISGDIIILLLCTTNDGHMMYGSWDAECDRIFLILYHFCPFTPLKTLKCKILKKQTKKQTNAFRYHHFTQVYHKWQYMIFGSWDMKRHRQMFLSFGPFFALLLHHWHWKLKFGKKLKELVALSFYTCEYHMMYGCWDIRHDGKSFLSFWAISWPLTIPTIQKIKILKKWKKLLEISSFYTSAPKIMILCYTLSYV